jgi:hypothetical protein
MIIKKCLEMSKSFNLRYMIIVTKCLAELNIRNINLLSQIEERLNKIIDINDQTEKPDELLKLSADSIAQILSNFVKLSFIDIKTFYRLENKFLDLTKKEGISSKETLLSILMTHSLFHKNILLDLPKETNSDKKIRREYKYFKKFKNVKNVERKKKNFIVKLSLSSSNTRRI